ncbi:hypothetical protein Sliba_00920 [Streptomyces nigrescens]|uniref:DUF642 domain-containing protein n=1 Tax=Streptomyces nigrescens TaxID=1920 RepID=A0A640T7D4_STRNI|nr:hypothetical protein Sliba_00920 [Streptomyces libani subsp. libani]GGW04446.1 hypothetical protein GCM10010500_66500 [Streptomyces libani subsp. libani]
MRKRGVRRRTHQGRYPRAPSSRSVPGEARATDFVCSTSTPEPLFTWVSQTFRTTAGRTYTVSYALAGNPAGNQGVKTGEVLIDGQNFQDFSFDTTGKTFARMDYVGRQVTFVATGASTTLSFASTTASGAYGPVIDNVRVGSCCSCSACASCSG